MKNNNLYIKTVSIFAVFLCIFTVVMFAVLIVRSILFHKQPKSEIETAYGVELTETEKKICSAQKEFTPQGQMLLIEETDIDTSQSERKIYDKDYNLLWEGSTGEIPAEYITLEQDVRKISRPKIAEWVTALTPDMKKTMTVCNKAADGKIENWRYNDSGYFEGFTDGKIIGYFAANGFIGDENQITKFKDLDCMFAYTEDSIGRTPILLCQADSDLYLIDIKKRQFKLLYEDIGEASISLHNWFAKDTNDEYIGTILIEKCSENPIVIFRKDFAAIEVSGFNINDRAYTLEIAAAKDIEAKNSPKFLIATYLKDQPPLSASKEEKEQWRKNHFKMKHTQVYQLYSLSDSGNAEFLSENQGVFALKETNKLSQAAIDSYESKAGYFLDISPVTFHYLAKTDFVRNAKPGSKVIKETLGAITTFKPYHNALAWILGCVCAVGVFVHNRNRTQNKVALAGWMAFALLFNVAGLLTCLALTHYDLIKCDNCGRKRHLLTENCLHCGKPMLKPVPQATDIISS